MRLNPKIPLSDSFQARIAAQCILRNQFDPKRVVSELRPDIKCYGPFFAKLMDEPAVRHELEVIMNRTERNSTKYVKMLWDWLEAENPEGTKETEENRRTAARLLGKAYIDTKGRVAETVQKPMVIEGLEEGLANLTGDESKVM